MRVVLAFPPRASATYVPLGIAILAPYMETAVPGTAVRLVDLNLAAWRWLAGAHPSGMDLMAFLSGNRGQFLNAEHTLAHKQIWDQIRKTMAHMGRQAEAFLAGGEAEPLFLNLLGALTGQLLDFDPELVGISVLFPEQVPFAAALARAVRQVAGCRIILGGAMMSALDIHELLMGVPEIDGVVEGEGEEACAALCAGKSLEAIPGLVFRDSGGIRTNPKSRSFSLDGLPAPDFSQLPLDAYFNPVPVLPVLFSRGCVWRRCRFCTHNFSFGGYRKKTVEAFVLEIEQACRQYHTHHFYSADEFITAQDMDAISTVILAKGLSINLHILGKPVAECTRERMALWAAAGCRWIGWGVETGSQRLLDLINKGTHVRDIRQVLEDAASVGIANTALMIFGLPTSTDQDLIRTLDFLTEIYPHVHSFTASAFVLHERTHFARHADRYGLHIDGIQTLFSSRGVDVKSRRLKFREIGSDGSLRSPRGALEVAAWIRHRRWLGDPPLEEQLTTEHYLIHVSKPSPVLGSPQSSSADPELA
ncbi:B12-binding domain-containing radical SAM protein [uncultured Desulfobacter sp.]|uniref:B12-binding domain-containing radical SAM protein n=1 Tax=uncultured Desulfobacter sp. TaxID=240139 RepID=UPI002AAB4930|nr:radical SAM protein [uncultured Desulfobacter sp.]